MLVARIKEPFDGPYYKAMVRDHGFLYTVVDDVVYNPISSPNFLVLRSFATGTEQVAHRNCVEFVDDAEEL